MRKARKIDADIWKDSKDHCFSRVGLISSKATQTGQYPVWLSSSRTDTQWDRRPVKLVTGRTGIQSGCHPVLLLPVLLVPS